VSRTTIVFAVTGALVVVGALFFRPSAGADAPRRPSDDGEVLERLPAGGGASPERLRLRRALAARPDDLSAAVALARLDIQTSRRVSDPRYLGYAQAALAPWWDQPAPPSEVRVLRATIRQSLHDFDGALVDLDAVVASTPGDPQAWITRSVVLSVLGRYDEARASCGPLARLAPPLVTAVCVASIDALTGSAATAHDRLAAAIASSPRLTPEENEWATSTLGEIALRLGRAEDAERDFKSALAIDPDDSYALAAYADLLLDAGRAGEVAKLVGARTDNDNLLLRLALADAALGARGDSPNAALLAARYDASKLRGDTVHRREEARFELHVRRDKAAALALARANWDVQREPWDVRALLEAALAANDAAAAAPALAFLEAHHLEDPTIHALAAKLGGRP
jgi:predicted Zn-dependent protease